ncbi:alcohol dehydrogenase catalytic domain-containing protein [Marinobacter sp. CHS3-4]|uniref:alcohol dehydrogenase catalytic domain-containing protein n=1 Tax=Marinobacter sp. CHS3-4 TaxID=3045174 RepID=UPI0024B4CDB4|nr:alcohol dehydrogenase catalytic domain-containing protein [Marinobacter sp. CHS3-4]MDI9244630.1 alcohol dehydrogenase catalytic domain-containing protein [Marinobacter sp. CHS3-4]
MTSIKMNVFAINDYASGALQVMKQPLPPPPETGQVQLALRGTSINPIDQLIAKGYGAPLFNGRNRFPQVLGRDGVAEVLAIGRGVTDLKPGQRVLVAVSPKTGGTYAEVFNVPRRCVAPIADSLPDQVAAGLGYAGLTALQALDALGLSPGTSFGKRLCINGASGGVGSIALVLASRWGADITAVASRKNHAWLQTIADCQVIDYRDPEAVGSISSDLILNLASPAEEFDRCSDPLLAALRARSAKDQCYATTVTPILPYITSKGIVGGLVASGKTYLQRRLRLKFKGIDYHWVMFRENPEHLAFLADVFAESQSASPVGARSSLRDLPSSFSDPGRDSAPGKMVFLAED